MQRVAFDRSVSDGFRTAKVESIVTTLQGRRLFVGTSDGFLTLYECRQEQSVVGSRNYSCHVLESIRKQSKEKKPATMLQNLESWRVILGIIDTVIYAYDSQFYQQLATIPDSKGCHLYSTNEAYQMIIVANKKKLTQYQWQDSSFQTRKEFALVDVPKNVYYVGSAAIIGYKKHYECLDLMSGGTSRILDVDKEHKMVIAELPYSAFRHESILLSLGSQGVVLRTESILAGESFAFGSANEEHIEWTAPPTSVQILNPFLLSLLSDGSVEIHDLASLSAIQRIAISSNPHALSLAICPYDTRMNSSASSNSGNSFSNHAYLCNGEQLSVLRMIPLSSQVDALVGSNMFEEAINLCTVCEQKDMLAGIDMLKIYEASANSLLAKGDFEKAIQRFILSKTDFLAVAKNFPDFIPMPLHLTFGITQTKKLTGAVLHRAAAAIVQFCDAHRAKLTKRADRAEKSKDMGIIGSSQLKGASKHSYGGNEHHDDEDEEYIEDADEEIQRAQLLDTMNLFALMNCNPIKRSAVIDLLSSPNRCHIESSSVLLASHGNTFTEPLLWLYRSQGQHERVLQALSEDKCVAVGAWTKDQFYTWTADYLRWLWYHEGDPALPRQALVALKPVLEYDAELGLSVLVSRPQGKTSFGGKRVSISEVLNFLRATNPKRNYARGSAGLVATAQSEKGVAAIISSTPLVNGHALGVAFLECLVSSGEAPSSMHDEFAQLLVEGLPFDNEISVDHSRNDLVVRSEDDEAMQLYKVYRRKLQNFLLNSQEYHPHRVLKFLPRQYLHENALVLSKLGRHREVLKIYLQQLKSRELAESYCDRIYAEHSATASSTSATLAGHPSQSNSLSSTNNSAKSSKGAEVRTNVTNTLSSAGEIYLIMFAVMLGEEDLEDVDPVEQEARLRSVVKLAEKHFDRFDTNAFLELLPRATTTVALLLKYMQLVLEFQNTRKRNLQIAHHLLRSKEVRLCTKGIDINQYSEDDSNVATLSSQSLNFHR